MTLQYLLPVTGTVRQYNAASTARHGAAVQHCWPRQARYGSTTPPQLPHLASRVMRGNTSTTPAARRRSILVGQLRWQHPADQLRLTMPLGRMHVPAHAHGTSGADLVAIEYRCISLSRQSTEWSFLACATQLNSFNTSRKIIKGTTSFCN
jgi:hypothetical protein